MNPLSDPQFVFWLLIISKHFLCEFILQTSYQATHKGIYGHPSGLIHAAITVSGTAIALYLTPLGIPLGTLALILFVEAVVHYHQDWLKITITKAYKIEVLSDPFWWAFGIDQFLHFVFYLGLYWWIFLY